MTGADTKVRPCKISSPESYPVGLIVAPKSYQNVIPAKAGIQDIVAQAARRQPILKALNVNNRG